MESIFEADQLAIENCSVRAIESIQTVFKVTDSQFRNIYSKFRSVVKITFTEEVIFTNVRVEELSSVTSLTVIEMDKIDTVIVAES